MGLRHSLGFRHQPHRQRKAVSKTTQFETWAETGRTQTVWLAPLLLGSTVVVEYEALTLRSAITKSLE